MSMAIKVSGLTVHFNKHVILHDINIDFTRHQINVLVGHSGSGKTTLLRALNRLNEEFEGCHTNGHTVFLTH